jgi:ADP-ribose pyrophosphatase YjhB (NUDIX family)
MYNRKFSYNKHTSFRNKQTCNNCGKMGHFINNCDVPATSNGLIVYRINAHKELEYLMICRKNTYGYAEFVKGCYSTTNESSLMQLIDEMTVLEKQNLLNTTDFFKLWSDMWNVPYTGPPEPNAKNTNKLYKKFLAIKAGLENTSIRESSSNPVCITLDELLQKSTTSWKEPEWEFPKGRRLSGESDITCALREFKEETGIRSQFINMIENIKPFEESIIGSNMRPYKNVYYIAQLSSTMSSSNDIDLSNFQKSEVSQLKWVTYDECINNHIRPYNIEKLKIIKDVNNILLKYLPYTVC